MTILKKKREMSSSVDFRKKGRKDERKYKHKGEDMRTL
jgi:hypothetical protein